MNRVRRVWVTRTRPGADRTARRLVDAGFDPVVAPLLEVRPVPHDTDLSGVAVLAFTSAHAVAGFDGGPGARSLPVFAVGQATARAARAAGYACVHSADGDVVALGRRIAADAPPGLVLHPCGRDVAAPLEVGADRRLATRVVYETVPTGVQAPPAFDAVLVQSPRAASILARRWPSGWPDRIAACQSPAIADALGGAPFARRLVAAEPREADLLLLLGKPGPRV